jgi:hypothetical protein
MMTLKKPFGIKIIGWCECLVGLLGTLLLAFCTFFYLWSLYATSKGIDKPITPGDPSAEMIATGILPFLILVLSISLIFLGVGIGILKLRSWARKAYLIISSIILIIIAIALFPLFFHLSSNWLALLWLLLTGMLILASIWYFNKNNIKEAFLAKRPGS